jgi:CheY-like chemotaxis protein
MFDDTNIPRSETPAQKSVPPSVRVLLVDDQDDLLTVMHLMLQRKSGYTVETAQSGRQAIEKAPNFSPHVVVSDLTMPGMDGVELMENLRKLEGGKLSPFKAIALSGYDSLQDDRVLGCGYDAHLTKPVDFEVLIQTIDRMALDMGARDLKTND